MKKIIPSVLFFISAGNCFGQQVIFEKTYGDNNMASGRSVIQTSDGGYLIAGLHYSFNTSSIYLVKTDSQGNILWTNAIDNTSYNRAYSVKQASDGGYIIAGAKDSASFFHFIYLVKTDSIGSVQWAKTFAGSGDNDGYSVIQSFDGGYVVTGVINNIMVVLIKIDGSGNIIWDKAIDMGGPSIGFSVIQTSDSGFVVCGIMSAGINDNYLILFKTNSMGIMLWDKIYGGIQIWGNSVTAATDGSIIVTGTTDYFGAGNSDMLLLKTNSNGNLLWAKAYGNSGDEGALTGIQTSDNGYLLIGSRDSALSGNSCGYVVKTDSSGNEVWSKAYEFPFTQSTAITSGLQTVDGGYIFTGGYVGGNITLIKTDSLGNSGCNTTSISTQSFMSSIPVNSPLVISVTAGLTSSTLSPYESSIGTDSTICITVGIQSAIPYPQSAITIFPNPTTNNFTITFPNTINKGVLEIYNVMGEKIFKEDVFNISQKEIRLNNINAGIYFVKVKDGKREYTSKLVVK